MADSDESLRYFERVRQRRRGASPALDPGWPASSGTVCQPGGVHAAAISSGILLLPSASFGPRRC